MPSIFFLATDTKKPVVSAAIKLATGEAYNHASVAFDPLLRWCYSFNMAADGFKMERPDVWPEATVFALYRAELSDAAVAAAKKFIASVRKKDLTFSYRGLAGVVLGRPTGSESQMFCSEFVERTAVAAGMSRVVTDPQLATPLKVCARPGASLVARGRLHDHIKRLKDTSVTPEEAEAAKPIPHAESWEGAPDSELLEMSLF